jgi:hypothetical protein
LTTVTEKRQQERSKSEWIRQAAGSGRRKATSSADWSVERRHIHADSASGSTYDLQMGTCRMSQSDQQELLPTRKSAPATHLLLPPPAAGEWRGRRRASCKSPSSSFGPLKKAMATAPLTQTAVPKILARLRGLLTSTLSSLSLIQGIRDGWRHQATVAADFTFSFFLDEFELRNIYISQVILDG